MKTIISMKYNEKSNMPTMYSERYGISYAEIGRKDEWVYIEIPIDECITDNNSISIICDILKHVLRAEPTENYISEDYSIWSNSLIDLELALVDVFMKKSDEKHYSKKIKKFYSNHAIKINGYIPELKYYDDGSCSIVPRETDSDYINISMYLTECGKLRSYGCGFCHHSLSRL
ncbi:MAG: hypothetical protein ACI4JN_11690 [Ruminococcus sp.]